MKVANWSGSKKSQKEYWFSEKKQEYLRLKYCPFVIFNMWLKTITIGQYIHKSDNSFDFVINSYLVIPSKCLPDKMSDTG